jgi:hypothetical protein
MRKFTVRFSMISDGHTGARRYKKISCVIVRGAYFCPTAVECISEYLEVPANNMIIGNISYLSAIKY